MKYLPPHTQRAFRKKGVYFKKKEFRRQISFSEGRQNLLTELPPLEVYVYPLIRKIFERTHDKASKMAYAPIEDSEQPGHPPGLISRRCPHEVSFGL